MAEFLAQLREAPSLRGAVRHHEIVPARPARWVEQLPATFAPLREALRQRGIAALYQHQFQAAERIAAGDDVVLATPTASGKTLVYNLPVLRGLLDQPPSRALYLFPLRALEHDQRARLSADVAALKLAPEAGRVAIYDGDTPRGERRRLRKAPPSVLITTPDMLHLGLLPHHGAWRSFFSGLRTVVIDELHAYRGIFGSHVAQVLRRLLRVAAHHGARPQLVAASATIANPGELARALTGRSFSVVQSDGAPRPRRHFLLLNPAGSPHTAAARLFRLALAHGLRTIAFTKARRITELMHAWIVEAEPALRDRISSYRAGFLPEERREIEQRLFRGELRGVISTSALELGIDVGGLDVCLLVGYPGSQISTWQRAGRVGRSREATVLLVAHPDALDQYLVSHPRAFFQRGFEHAVVDPHNPELAGAHLPCAAVELPLRQGEAWLRETGTSANLASLEERGLLLRSEAGGEWFAARSRPHRDVDLRNAGSSYSIELARENDGAPVVVGTIGGARVLAECHEGAIYLHRGRQFLVTELALDERRVRVRAVSAPYFTRALSEKETEILTREALRPCGNLRVGRGRLRVTTRITGFERRRIQGQELLGSERLELPPICIETSGIWLEIPHAVPESVRGAGEHPMGGLHAVEHAALALVPLFALCDRHDVGGITMLHHRQVGQAAIFLYDAHAGGAGLAASLFERVEALLSTTLELIEGCACQDGCPGCVHSPKCGSGNRPIDKAAAIRSLQLLLRPAPLPEPARLPTAPEPAPARDGVPATRAADRRRVLFFDLETQRSAEEVGGWHNAHRMGLSVAVVYDARDERFERYDESKVKGLIERLRESDLVVGFNVQRFDYQVLRGYSDQDFSAIPTFDLLEAVHARIGFRISLGHLAEQTLGAAKSADGLQALQWWKEGRVEEIARYCRQDVALVRDLFDRALKRGHLLFRTRSGERVRIPTPWTLEELIERAQAGRGSTAQCRV